MAKQSLMSQIHDLYNQADSCVLDEDGWVVRYFFKEKMVQFLATEDEY